MFDFRSLTPAQRNAIRVRVRQQIYMTLGEMPPRLNDATMAAIQTGRITPSSASGAPKVV